MMTVGSASQCLVTVVTKVVAWAVLVSIHKSDEGKSLETTSHCPLATVIKTVVGCDNLRSITEFTLRKKGESTGDGYLKCDQVSCQQLNVSIILNELQ